MIKLRFIALCFVTAVYALVLVSCGGQPISSEADTPAVKDAGSNAGKAAEAEPPAIEIIARKDLDAPKISMEPLPADEPEEEPKALVGEASEGAESRESKQEAPKEEPALETVVSESKTSESEEALKEVAPPAAKPEKMPATIKAVPAQKIQTPPALGKGHVMGFLINGVSGKRLVLERGKVYTFDIRTDPKHDVYLSKKAIGWGSAPIAEGVTGAYTYKGKMEFSPSDLTPGEVYYACRNHPHMGALIQVINPGEKATEIKQQATSTGASVAQKSTKVTVSQVKQKLMFAEMMYKSKGSRRVLASQNDEAKQLLKNAKSQLSEGREKSLVGALPEALTLANESLKMMSEATRLVPGKEEMAQLAENYKTSLAEIHGYLKSHESNVKRLVKTGPIPEGARYDEVDVNEKLSHAQSMADKKNYVRANAVLGEVQKIITLALHKMLDSTTLVYDLNFATAADEYEYELKRFVGYEELIPVAIEAKKPAPGAIKLMESFHEKARKRRDQAVAKAATGKYGDAIAMLQQATKTVRRALRMVGVMQ